jgi:endonuclease I
LYVLFLNEKIICVKNALLIFLIIVASRLIGQFDFQSVYPDLEGGVLLEKLVENYKPAVVLDYSNARDTLYKVIYNINDTVYGVYTNYGIFLPDNVDPSTYLYNNGKPSGINAEHTFPRSKGAGDGNAKSDMHHLFPSKINVNSDRGSLPFHDIDDNKTKDWYYRQTILHKIPTKDIDEYSEHIDVYFEPREAHKGNVARAMFYFYTMYKQQADAEDPSYFEKQKATLCNWHFQDPVDSLEWIRTWMIAGYQDNKPNPFVLDCSLASRTYCDFISDACTLVENKDIVYAKDLNLKLYPNPVNEELNISFINPGLQKIHIEISGILGNKIYSRFYILENSELENLKIRIGFLNQGIYIFKINGMLGNKIIKMNKLFVKN